MMAKRLKYALSIVAVFAWPGAVPAAPFSEPSRLEKPQAGFYRLKIGKIDVIAVNDGAASFDILDLLPKDKREIAAKIMAKSYVKSPVEASVNAYIILLGGRTILVDAGTGELLGAQLGKLPDSLRAAGVTLESISDVLLTHIHPDHSGGLTVGDNKTFPNATIHVNKKEFEFWTDKSMPEKYPEPTKTFFGQVTPTVGPYVASGQVKTFEGGAQIFPGIRSLPAYGHTPGHTYYVLEDGREKLVFWGDTIHAPDAQFTDPSITIGFDVDQKAASAQRQKAFADAAKNGYLVALDHMYFPGIGRLRKEKVGYRWIPAPYINDSQKP
jgi:glyoxylase-like metal-dependent hydrolase (beta-lactamase superfamily II)